MRLGSVLVVVVLHLAWIVLSSSTKIIQVNVKSNEKENYLGRVRVYFSKASSDGSCAEPRSACDDSQQTAQVFGVDADNIRYGDHVIVNETTLGYPMWSLNELPMDVYCVQAELGT